MGENNNEKKGNIAYLLIGVLTLVLATAGATFAYFTTTDDDDTTLTGNMATITFSLFVDKMSHADDLTGTDDHVEGLIPMSNSMVQSALTANAGNNGNKKGICVDDNGNAVCQIYKITVVNNSTASMFVDGYVTLTGGTGTAEDWPNEYYNDENNETTIDYDTDESRSPASRTLNSDLIKNNTTMRWAQVFCDETSGTISNCTTVGKTTTTASKSTNGVDAGITANWTAIENTKTTEMDKDTTEPKVSYGYTGFNRRQILTSGITTKATIASSDYNVINTNFIRISNHAPGAKYTQADDITSALVYNEFLESENEITNPAGGSSASYTDSQVYYIVVWLSETGTNQTIAHDSEDRIDFFEGTVKFVSAQGSEVTSTFSGYSRVQSDQA